MYKIQVEGEVILTITSCKTLRVASDILSNSSIQQTPPSLNTRAPLRKIAVKQRVNHRGHIDMTNLSKTSCFVSASRVTYAVKPTAEDPFPDAKTPRGAIL